MLDYYQILEIPRGATNQEIKTGYRKLAMKWHPDKNLDNIQEARLKFQEIAEAYYILSHSDKKAIFDQYGYDGLRDGVPDADGEMRNGYTFDNNAETIFINFFGTSNPFSEFGFGDTMPFGSTLRKKGPEKAPAIEKEVVCSLEELYSGKAKKITVARSRIDSSKREIKDEKEFTIQVKAGWQNGTIVKFEKEGNETALTSCGDVAFRIVQEEHKRFTREGNDLIFTASIKLSEALADCCVELITLDNRKLAISCNEVISPTTEKIVEGEGMPILNSNKEYGNIRIRFNIRFPKYLNDQQKKTLVKVLG